jgi:hypothetical protein
MCFGIALAGREHRGRRERSRGFLHRFGPLIWMTRSQISKAMIL